MLQLQQVPQRQQDITGANMTDKDDTRAIHPSMSSICMVFSAIGGLLADLKYYESLGGHV
jgi:hypothetical protein